MILIYFPLLLIFRKRDGSDNIDTISSPKTGISILHRGIHYLHPDSAIRLVKDKKLVVIRDGESEALPALRDVWDTVGGLDVGAIEQTLLRKARDARRSVEGNLEVFGLKVKSSVAVVAGPCVLIALLLYLLAHVYHLRTLAQDEDGLLSEFPWVALFDTWLSKILTYGSLLLLPVLGLALIVSVSNLGRWQKTTLLVVYCGAAVAAAGATLRTLRPLAVAKQRISASCIQSIDVAVASQQLMSPNPNTAPDGLTPPVSF